MTNIIKIYLQISLYKAIINVVIITTIRKEKIIMNKKKSPVQKNTNQNNEQKTIKQKVSYKDPQLKDIIDNFNEIKEYSKKYKI